MCLTLVSPEADLRQVFKHKLSIWAVILENFSKGGGAGDRKRKAVMKQTTPMGNESPVVLELLGEQCRICLRDIPTRLLSHQSPK